ncbi:hypothetical protein WJN01_04955 [Flavobacteriaceae bacterium SZ-1-7]|uniref:hypothetical protein n=1 Tax=Tamlana sedimenti TaxID=3134126 RepID=UPI0031280BFD
MKSFLLKLSFIIIALAGVYGFLVNRLSQDFVDIYYEKFTQKAGGLIIGISKANKGINPEIIEQKLQALNYYDTPLINYALNVNNSPFGEVYLESIKKKIKPIKNRQLFIVSVSPGAFSTPLKMKSEDIYKMDKNHTILGKVNKVDTKPNYNYIINTYELPLYNALHPYDKWLFYELHPNGWLEIRPNTEIDSIKATDIAFWKAGILKEFEAQLGIQQISSYRIESFIKILEFFKTRGDVFIVRIPQDEEFNILEHKLWPSFEQKMDSIAKQYNVPFLNYSNLANKFKTYDGLHFDTNGATQFTEMLSEDIYVILKNKEN